MGRIATRFDKNKHNREYYRKNKTMVLIKQIIRRKGFSSDCLEHYDDIFEEMLPQVRKVRKTLKRLDTAGKMQFGNSPVYTMYSRYDLARLVGKSPETLKKWTDFNIIPETGIRNKANFRAYFAQHVFLIAFVIKLFPQKLYVKKPLAFTTFVSYGFNHIQELLEKGELPSIII